MTSYVDSNRGPSPVPYLALGAAAGAGGGAALAHYANFGIPTQAYSSWEEAVAATNKDDEFIKKAAGKENEAAKNWKSLQTAREGVEAARKEALTGLADDVVRNADVGQYLDEAAKYQSQVDDLLAKVKAGTAVEGLNVAELKDKADDVIKEEIEKLSTVQAQKKVVDEALTTAKSSASGFEGCADDVIKNYAGKKKTALEGLTDDALKTMKKANWKWTALAGAAALGVLGLLVAPKKKDA